MKGKYDNRPPLDRVVEVGRRIHALHLKVSHLSVYWKRVKSQKHGLVENLKRELPKLEEELERLDKEKDIGRGWKVSYDSAGRIYLETDHGTPWEKSVVQYLEEAKSLLAELKADLSKLEKLGKG